MDFYYLLDVKVEGRILTLRFYRPASDKIVEIKDLEYRPYFFLSYPLSKKDKERAESLPGQLEVTNKIDLFDNNLKKQNKVTIYSLEAFRKASKLFKILWEAEVKYTQSYAYDHGLVFGAAYKMEKNHPVLVTKLPEELESKFEAVFAELKSTDQLKYDQIRYWFNLLHQPVPQVDLDILEKERVGSGDIRQAFMLARIANIPVAEAFGSKRVSDWLRSIIYSYLRKNGILIPTSGELRRGFETHRVPGALTVRPKEGTYFNTIICDFESLYPSCIDSYNLSYETVNCKHERCRSNRIDECSEHWICRERRGFYSILVGALKDLRIRWFKPLSNDAAITKEERDKSKVLSRLLKLMSVSSYGVTVRIHGLACPPLAECITGYGRWVLKTTWNLAESEGLNPIYGDTDSLFLDNPPKKKVEWLIKTVKKKLKLDLAIEKRYSLCVLPATKKAYFGIKSDDEPDIKGLTAIKSNSPNFIQKVFLECVEKLKQVSNHHEYEVAKKRILKVVQNAVKQLRNREVKLVDLTYSVKLYLDPKERLTADTHSTPQPYQCAIQLLDAGKQVEKSDTVHFIKVKPFNYKRNIFTVKPREQVRDVKEINVEDYVRNLKTALEQTFAPMGINLKQKTERKISEWFE